MKRSTLILTFAFVAFLSTAFLSEVWATRPTNRQEDRHGNEHGSSVKQYEAFHDVLHPLQHEALPGNDFPRVRAQSAQLVKHGKAIVRLGVPRGTSKENRAEFVRELKKFSSTLTKFRNDARRGTDGQLKTSFDAVHDSYEMLAAMLPRK